MRFPRASRFSQVRARCIRGKEPKALVTTGKRAPLGCSKKRAGPTALDTRSVTAAISRYGSSGVVMRRKASFFSRMRKNSCKSL